ncbi:YHYH protein [Marinobacter sp. ANT_B65]|uniref:YHYH protein n=1 Tax=Marinobacter sp. ANT_B65 TaxID=2039467 RepID=UPI000BBED878|nr:YHYH protein [Marinobacter sp. ANT_B65]PCM44570.1 hypothetical protein CPA50_00505 [Marinobacter sp. ANT_B65]
MKPWQTASVRYTSVTIPLALVLVLTNCMSNTPEPVSEPEHTHGWLDFFMPDALVKDVATVECTLSDGTATSCYEITVAGTPSNHGVGPFCPRTTTATEDEVGIWLDGDNLYDVTGQFILDLPSIYNDDHWMLHDGQGHVRVTDTKEAFEAAARPNVAEEYENYCVEGRMEWLEGGEPVTTTVQIPVTPVHQGTPTPARGPLGVTFNGIRIDAAAPVDAILGAHTIAAFDDCGGHVNPFEGYHMHAATGCSEVGDAPDGETPPFAVAMDGYLIHGVLESGDLDKAGDLDECNGHTTDGYGYHYHARSPELNGVLTCYMGTTINHAAGGPPGGGPPPGGEGFETPPPPHDHN